MVATAVFCLYYITLIDILLEEPPLDLWPVSIPLISLLSLDSPTLKYMAASFTDSVYFPNRHFLVSHKFSRYELVLALR